jgi:hypothetical protein
MRFRIFSMGGKIGSRNVELMFETIHAGWPGEFQKFTSPVVAPRSDSLCLCDANGAECRFYFLRDYGAP